MEQRISLVTLGIADLARARAFHEAIGWRGAKQPDDEVCFFQAGGMVFGLWTALGGHGAPGIELAHNVHSPQEVAAVLSEAERAGASNPLVEELYRRATEAEANDKMVTDAVNQLLRTNAASQQRVRDHLERRPAIARSKQNLASTGIPHLASTWARAAQ